MANSLKSLNPSKLLAESFILSFKFQIFPASINKALFSEPKTSNIYSKLNANFKFASLNSFPVLLEPGPSL